MPEAQLQLLRPEQLLLTTLIVKLAVMAALATMLVRYRRFRHMLIFERRGWHERLVFVLALGIPLAAGVIALQPLNYKAADLTLEGAFLAGVIAGPYAGAIVGAMVGLPPLVNGEFIALPFAVGCGFAGGGLRELCPKEAIWRFSPFIFSGLHRRAWLMVRGLQIDWQVILLLAPIALELLRQGLGARWGNRLFYLPLAPGSAWTLTVVLLATVLAVATPIKIWNNARIEHRLQEQEKLLLAAKIDAGEPDQPISVQHAHVHLLAHWTQPETARMLITKLSASCGGSCAVRSFRDAQESWPRSTSISTSRSCASDRSSGWTRKSASTPSTSSSRA
jgi:two-component system LytT family sensor kinase